MISTCIKKNTNFAQRNETETGTEPRTAAVKVYCMLIQIFSNPVIKKPINNNFIILILFNYPLTILTLNKSAEISTT